MNPAEMDSKLKLFQYVVELNFMYLKHEATNNFHV
jgi:hypothetical protein